MARLLVLSWLRANPRGKVITGDLTVTTIPVISAAWTPHTERIAHDREKRAFVPFDDFHRRATASR